MTPLFSDKSDIFTDALLQISERYNLIDIVTLRLTKEHIPFGLVAVESLSRERKILPFFGNKVIAEISGTPLHQVEQICITAEGRLCGYQKEHHLEKFVFIGDKLIKFIGKDKVSRVDSFTLASNGDLLFALTIWHNGSFLFRGEERIELSESIKNNHVTDFNIDKNNELIGRVLVTDTGERKRWVLLKGNRACVSIGGYLIFECESLIHSSQKDYAGVVQLKDSGAIVPFLGDKIITRIGRQSILNTSHLQFGANGELIGVATLSNQSKVIFSGESVIEKIGGKYFRAVKQLRVTAKGGIAGVASLFNGYDVPFIGDRLFEVMPRKAPNTTTAPVATRTC